eukprot:COSAG04_NODE_26930_length_289_cov_0.521053_1_plen_64_part_10
MPPYGLRSKASAGIRGALLSRPNDMKEKLCFPNRKETNPKNRRYFVRFKTMENIFLLLPLRMRN